MRRFFDFERGQWNPLAVATGVLLSFSVLLGGASREHEVRLAAIELAALPLLVIAIQTLWERGDLSDHRAAFWLLGGCAALPLFQLIPLPPDIWTNLPGRQDLVTALNLSGVDPGWTPLSLTPDKTWRSFLALFPPVAAFMATLAAPHRLRVQLAKGILAATTVAVVLGAAQLASGEAQLYPWRTTAPGTVAGLFANRNHLATLCLISLPFAAVLGAASGRRSAVSSKTPLVLSSLYVGLIVVSLGVIRSRAGIVLLPVVLVASFAAAWLASGRGRPRVSLMLAGSASGIACLAVAIFALAPLLQRFDSLAIHEGRFENWPTVMLAAERYLPLGAGLGSFDAVYRSVEPLSRLDGTFFNQAHNEYLETLLETGWIGIVLIGAFAVWFCRRSWMAWKGGASTNRDLQRAASIAILAILLHSIVDYPLRTATIATLFAVCSALLELAGRGEDAFEQRRRLRR